VSDTLTRPEQSNFIETNKAHEFVDEPGDHDKFAHYLKKKYHDAYVTGEEVEALCGYRWVPTRTPDKFPVCPECKDLYEALDPGDET
jgi:hypothetical protein